MINQEVTIKTTDLTKNKLINKELFFDKKIKVITRSGLHKIEANLIPILKKFPSNGNVLFIENRTGVAPLIYSLLHQNHSVTCYNLDIHHTNTIKRTLRENPLTKNISAKTNAMIKAENLYDLIVFQVAKDFENELTQEVLQYTHRSLHPGGKILFAHEGKANKVQDHIQKVFKNHSILLQEKSLTIATAKKKDALKKSKEYTATFEVTSPQKKSFILKTIPGVFAHRRIDGGAQALIDTIHDTHYQKIVDMGCGSGSIGIAIALQCINQPEIHFIDSSSRAVAATTLNGKNNHINGFYTHLTDKGLNLSQDFDLFIGNPPYFSDYKIAEVFLEKAHQCLKPGGVAYFVAKTINWYEENMENVFGNVTITNRLGYHIAYSKKE